MSSESGDVKITVDIILGANFDQASSKILQVAESLKAMGNASQLVANNLNGLDITAIKSVNVLGKISDTGRLSILRYEEQGEAVRNLMETMSGLGTNSVELNNKYARFMDTTGNAKDMLENLKDEFINSGYATEEQIKAITNLSNQYGKLAPMLELNDMSLNDFENSLSRAKLTLAMTLDPAVYDRFRTALEETGMSLDKFDTKFGITARSINKFLGNYTTLNNVANKLNVSYSDLIAIMPDLTDKMGGTISRSQILNKITEDLSNWTELSASQQQKYSEILSQHNIPIVEAIRSAVALRYETQNLTRAQLEFRGMLGVAGNVALQFSRQLFWVGLGGMFMAMSLDRMLSKGAQLKTQSLSLLRNQIALKEQYKQMKETIQDYGMGSDEAKKAIRDYNLSVEESKVQLESVRNTARSEAMATVMFFSSLTGQVFGMGSQLIQSLGPMLTQMQNMIELEIGQIKVLGGLKIAYDENNKSLSINYALNEGNNASTIKATATKTGYLSVTELLTRSLQRQNLALLVQKTLLIAGVGALAMLPVVIGTYAISMATANMQMESLNKSTKELEKSVNKLRKGSGIVDLTIATDDWTYSMANAKKQVEATNMKVSDLHSYTTEPTIANINPQLTSKNNFVNVNRLVIYGGEQNPNEIAEAVMNKLRRSMSSSGVTV